MPLKTLCGAVVVLLSQVMVVPTLMVMSAVVWPCASHMKPDAFVGEVTASIVTGLLVLPLLRMRDEPDTDTTVIVIPERVVHGDALHVQTG